MMRHYISLRELLILIPIAALFFAALVACQPQQQQTRSAEPRIEQPAGPTAMPADPKPADPASATPKPEAADPGTGGAARKEQ
jgi:hypothetical protein